MGTANTKSVSPQRICGANLHATTFCPSNTSTADYVSGLPHITATGNLCGTAESTNADAISTTDRQQWPHTPRCLRPLLRLLQKIHTFTMYTRMNQIQILPQMMENLYRQSSTIPILSLNTMFTYSTKRPSDCTENSTTRSLGDFGKLGNDLPVSSTGYLGTTRFIILWCP